MVGPGIYLDTAFVTEAVPGGHGNSSNAARRSLASKAPLVQQAPAHEFPRWSLDFETLPRSPVVVFNTTRYQN